MDGAVGKVIPLRRGQKRPRELSEEQQYQLRRVQLAQDILLDNADAVEQNLGVVLLAKLLGYTVKPFHREMLAFQYRHPDNLQLAYRGSGKCLAPGTLVIMADGRQREVERIRVGDQLMGSDSRPRDVVALGHGYDKRYRITPIKGESWECNSAHMLTLKGRGRFYGGRIEEHSLQGLIEKGKRNKRGTADIAWKLFRVPVEFPEKETPLDPYFMGLWLGDGTLGDSSITSADNEIVEWIKGYAQAEGYRVTVVRQENRCPRYSLRHAKGVPNLTRRYLRKTFPKRKYIPDVFLYNSRENRLKLLAGLLDSDGYYYGCYEITQKSLVLAKQLTYLARSVGLAAYLHKKIATIKSLGFVGDYYRVGISGNLDIIPCRIKRKIATPRRQAKDVLVTGFEIEDVGYGEYYGFELDGDGRFLLGDFTVTHNTTLCTVVKTVHLLLVDSNLRILLASDIKEDSKAFLREIKPHFETNQKLIETFGPYYDPKLVTKWDTEEINVLPRTKFTKEANIACVGADTAVASRHVDVIFSDDLVVEKNSRTRTVRNKNRTWYYQSLDPCLEPPDPEVPHRGEHHRLGTRYHWDELYGHLIENELRDHHQIYRGLLNGKSPWPEKHSPEWFEKKRKRSGSIIFGAQHLCDTELMKGEIFQYDDCQQIDASEVPEGLKVFMGTDLAVGKKSGDQFAQVVIGVDDSDNIYVLEAYAAHLRFKQQKEKWKDMYQRHDPIRAGIESNGYQDVMRADLKDDDKDLRVIPIHTSEDKTARGQKLSATFEDKRVFIVRGAHTHELIDQLVLLPGFDFDDLFDALDIAVRTSKKRKRRPAREKEPGLSW